MQRIVVCTGVLGGGTALVFLLAAMTAVLFPQGAVVSAGWNGNIRMSNEMLAKPGLGADVFVTQPGGWATDVPVPVPAALPVPAAVP